MEDDIKEFCDMYLSYLIDDGFKIIITKANLFNLVVKDSEIFVIVNILKNESTINYGFDRGVFTRNNFKWEDVKDNIIPFLDIFSKNFKVQPNYVKLTTNKGIKGYLARVIEDDLEMINISITVYKPTS